MNDKDILFDSQSKKLSSGSKQKFHWIKYFLKNESID